MKTEIRNELIKLGGTVEGKMLKGYINEKIFEISSSTLNAKVIEEVRGSQVAVKILKELFSFLDADRPKDKKGNQYL
jgi:hypothetical protein